MHSTRQHTDMVRYVTEQAPHLGVPAPRVPAPRAPLVEQRHECCHTTFVADTDTDVEALHTGYHANRVRRAAARLEG